MNWKISGHRVLVIGGGEVAERRVKTLLESEANIEIIAPKATDFLRGAAASRKIAWKKRGFDRADLNGQKRPLFIIVATPDEQLNREIAAIAHKKGIFVNMAAPPLEESDFTIPAHISEGNILISISTGGDSPALARLMRQEIQERVAVPFAKFLPQLIELRGKARERIPAEERKDFWAKTLSREIVALVQNGQYAEAEAIIEDALDKYRAKS